MDDVESFLSQSLHHELADEGGVLDEKVFAPPTPQFPATKRSVDGRHLAGERQNPE